MTVPQGYCALPIGLTVTRLSASRVKAPQTPASTIKAVAADAVKEIQTAYVVARQRSASGSELACGAAQLNVPALVSSPVQVLFGTGLALLGYCPGTTLTAIGEGRRDAMIGALGMLTGALLYVRPTS